MKRLKDRFWPPARSLSKPRVGLVGVMAAIAFFPVLLAIALPVQAAGPTGHLNDTGQTRCLNTNLAMEVCNSANSGDTAYFPQDGRFGRDAAAGKPALSGLTKPAGSGGSDGFAFTPLDFNGNAIPLTGNPPVPSATPRCIWDRVTNLIWEVKTNDEGLQYHMWRYEWGANTSIRGGCRGISICNTNNYISALNAASVCPVAGARNWRLPTRRELMSILDFDRSDNPSIYAAFFPNPGSSFNYWSADVYAPNPNRVWTVNYYGGIVVDNYYYGHVRLVRSGP